MAWRGLVVALAATAGCDALFGITTLPPDAAVSDSGLSDSFVRPDVAVGVCGVISAPCCNDTTCTDGSTCLSTIPGRSRCVAFAGAWEDNMNARCGTTKCLEPNPFTGQCGCPFGGGEVANIEGGCNETTAAQITTYNLNLIGLCQTATIPPGSDWAGASLAADIAACEPGSSPPACMVPNPVTGACSCPTNTEELVFRVWVPGTIGSGCASAFLGGELRACLVHNVSLASVVGAFQQDADGNCRVHSASLAACQCPGGTLMSNVRSIADPTTAPGVIQTTIAFCLAAP